MVPSLWPASARRVVHGEGGDGSLPSSIVRTSAPESALHSLEVASAPAETIQRSSSPLATATTAPWWPMRLHGLRGSGTIAARRRAAAVPPSAARSPGRRRPGWRRRRRPPPGTTPSASGARAGARAARPGRRPARGRQRRRGDGFGGARLPPARRTAAAAGRSRGRIAARPGGGRPAARAPAAAGVCRVARPWPAALFLRGARMGGPCFLSASMKSSSCPLRCGASGGAGTRLAGTSAGGASGSGAGGAAAPAAGDAGITLRAAG